MFCISSVFVKTVNKEDLLLTVTRSQTVSLCFTVESLFFCLINLFSRPSFLPLTHSCSPSHFTQAALMGGTTMVMAMVLPEQHCSLLDAYEQCRALADAKACCDYALHVGVTWWGPKVSSTEGWESEMNQGTFPPISLWTSSHSSPFGPSSFYPHWMNNQADKPFSYIGEMCDDLD